MGLPTNVSKRTTELPKYPVLYNTSGTEGDLEIEPDLLVRRSRRSRSRSSTKAVQPKKEQSNSGQPNA